MKSTTTVAAGLFVLMVSLGTPAQEGKLPKEEQVKIETLIKHVETLKDAVFVRNKMEYDAATAATFLRRKWKANADTVDSAKAFIEKVASVSGTSGHPYLIRFKDKKEIKSGDYLLEQLKKVEDKKGPS